MPRVARVAYIAVSVVLICGGLWAFVTAATIAPSPQAASLDPSLVAFNTTRALLAVVGTLIFIPGWLGLGLALRR